MQDVKHAVSHHHFLTALAGAGNGLFQLRFAHHAKTSISPTTHRVFQFNRRNGGGSQFTNHNTGCSVGKIARLFQCVTRRQRRRQHADYRIARTGHVIHFLRLRRHMQWRFARLQQRHPLF